MPRQLVRCNPGCQAIDSQNGLCFANALSVAADYFFLVLLLFFLSLACRPDLTWPFSWTFFLLDMCCLVSGWFEQFSWATSILSPHWWVWSPLNALAAWKTQAMKQLRQNTEGTRNGNQSSNVDSLIEITFVLTWTRYGTGNETQNSMTSIYVQTIHEQMQVALSLNKKHLYYWNHGLKFWAFPSRIKPVVSGWCQRQFFPSSRHFGPPASRHAAVASRGSVQPIHVGRRTLNTSNQFPPMHVKSSKIICINFAVPSCKRNHRYNHNIRKLQTRCHWTHFVAKKSIC